MSRRSSWMIGIGAVAAIGLGLLAVKALRPGEAPTGAAGPALAIDRDARAPAVAVAPPVAGPVPPVRQDPAASDRVMPYRPSTYLRYSAGVPAVASADDDASPIVQRIIAVTSATQEQELAIRAAWRNHEDGRRELLVAAAPPSIGDPILDPLGLAALDRELAEALQAVLTPAQQARLALELAPAPPAPPEAAAEP